MVTRAENRAGKPVIAIDFSGTGITDDDLATAARLRRLETLDLSETASDDVGSVHLRGLIEVRTPNLSHTKVPDQGVKTFQQALPKCGIER
jgi:internalin A